MNLHELLSFGGFIILIIIFLIIDLGVFDKKAHVVSFKESLMWTIIWIVVSVLFFLVLRFFGNELHGPENMSELKELSIRYKHNLNFDGLSFQEAIKLYNHNLSIEYITGYLVEKSLSIDNIFVFILIFASFGIPEEHYKRVLTWGIIGAVLMRFIFIFVSSALIQKYAWILYIFGGFLVIAGLKMFFSKSDEKKDPSNNFIVKWLSKRFNITETLHGQDLIFREKGKVFLTPLFITLVVVELSDVIFAIDSIPAVFAVTKDPFVVFFSNIFAILGLRSMFFLLNNIIDKFRFLKVGLAVLLLFIGLKMLLIDWIEKSAINYETWHSLIIIFLILLVSVLASIMFPAKEEKNVQ